MNNSTLIDLDEDNVSCFCFRSPKIIKHLIISQSSFYLALELKGIDLFPCENKEFLKNSSFSNFRQYNSDFYEAASYSFFEKLLQSENLSFIKSYLENSEKFDLLRILPLKKRLKGWSEATLAKIEKSREKFLQIFEEMRGKLQRKEQSGLDLLTNFYSKDLNEELHYFFKVFLRGYLLGRFLQNNSWEHLLQKNKENLQKLFDLEAKSVSLSDLLLVETYTIYQIKVLKMNDKGTCVQKMSVKPAIILANSCENHADITLLEYKGKFFNFYDKFSCFRCGEPFQSSLLISCESRNKHYACAKCLFPQKNLRNSGKCSFENCAEEINAKDLEKFCEKHGIPLEVECLVCRENVKKRAISQENVCEKCKKTHLFEKKCPVCETNMKKTQIFQDSQQFFCEKEQCHTVFCNKCHKIGENVLVCECFCRECGELLSGASCENCEKMCCFCRVSYSDEEFVYKTCTNCKKKTCRNCWIAQICAKEVDLCCELQKY